MPGDMPETLIREVVAACGACEDCRQFIGDACLFLPELFRLNDRMRDGGGPPTTKELHALIGLCTLCGICPCRNVRAKIVAAKCAGTRRDGLPLGLRAMVDVERLGKLSAKAPGLCNRIARSPSISGVLNRALGIHPDRVIPLVPPESFDAWSRRQSETVRETPSPIRRKVAYFPGCSARFIFPEVAKSAVEVLESAGAQVIVPSFRCCGMPPLLEGDAVMALDLASRNLERMAALIADGYDIVCSCPTCGYFFRELLREGAYYSQAYQHLHAGGDPKWMRIPAGTGIDGPREGETVVLSRAIYGRILRDDGLFSPLDPLKRIAVAEHAYDLGEYLAGSDAFAIPPLLGHPVPFRAVYYPPCHLREQKIGFPFLTLLERVPGLSVTGLTNALNCCGMAGIMGLKTGYHEKSLILGAPLMDKIRAHHPDVILTECLSCRMQFEQMADIPVLHPVEVLRESTSG
jgi:glycerol-3-phosphate dehydrogenase subunit C